MLAVGAVALIGLGVFWDPVGARKGGRVLIEEYHPPGHEVWERTDKPFDTKWYGNMSGYNYYCIFDYCGHYYDVSRLTKPVDDAALQACDVLILKIPTRAYSARRNRFHRPLRGARRRADDDRRAHRRSGRPLCQGWRGSVPAGDQNDACRLGTSLNSVAEKFGFSYRFDCLFGIDSVFKEHYDQPLVPHPMIQDMPAMDFAISCSIDPGTSTGRTVIRNAGLKNLMADYHADNFYPQAEDSAEMEYGSFIQLWAARFGQGRVAAFTDSTVFSNFCTFEPGKSELMMGMLEWLNHQGGPNNPRPWLVAAGDRPAARAVDGPRSGSMRPGSLLVAGGLLGWTAAALGSRAIHRHGMPPPPLQRPLVQMVIDRTLCDGPLSDAGFIEGKEDGFGIFERWILRLGILHVAPRGKRPRLFPGRCPRVPLSPSTLAARFPRKTGGLCARRRQAARRRFTRECQRYGRRCRPGRAGSGSNSPSASNELLEPFGLAVDFSAPVSGKLDSHGKWPSVPIARAAVVTGGEALAWIDEGARKTGPSRTFPRASEGREHKLAEARCRSVRFRRGLGDRGRLRQPLHRPQHGRHRRRDSRRGAEGGLCGPVLVAAGNDRGQAGGRARPWRRYASGRRAAARDEHAKVSAGGGPCGLRMVARRPCRPGLGGAVHVGRRQRQLYTGYWDTTIGNNVWQSGSSSVAWSNSPVNDALFATYPATVYVDGAGDRREHDVRRGRLLALQRIAGIPSRWQDRRRRSTWPQDRRKCTCLFAGTSGMTKSGSGTLELEWPNSYSGSTTVTGGVLRLCDPDALPGGTATVGGTSNLVLDGGVVELASGDFTRGLGTAASQVQFRPAGGGFSALGGSRIVNLGGSSATLTWGSAAVFLPNGAA